jgi:hypothetical protein
LYVLEERAIRKVILELSNKDLRPSAKFKAEVAAVVNSPEPRVKQYDRLHKEVFYQYGYYFPTRVVLGGKWVKELRQTSSDRNEQSRLIQEIKTSASGKAPVEGAGSFGLGLAYGNYSDLSSNLQIIEQTKKQNATRTGGAAAASIDAGGPWENSLAPMASWAVIETHRLLPIISLLEGDSAADELRRQCISLINEFASNPISDNHTTVDMEAYVAYLHAREAEKLSLL